MQTKAGFSMRFDLAKDKALELIEQRDQDQKILIVAAGNKPLVKTGFLDDSGQAKRLVRDLTPSDASGDLEQGCDLCAV
jgi:hypothetical protein